MSRKSSEADKCSRACQKMLFSSRLGERKIGYSLFPAKDASKRATAIVIFYPLSATSLLVDAAAETGSLDNYHANVICVDRPGVAKTDALPCHTTSIERIERHADDVLAVLNHHGVKEVYLLGVCLGHPYAVQVARRLITSEVGKQGEHAAGGGNSPELKGLTLVAPFVSPACSDAWGVARLGASVPSFVLAAATSSFSWIGSISMAAFLTPQKLAKLISDQEQDEFGWSNDENGFERAVSLALEMNKLTRDAQSIEACFGADPSWQKICDDFCTERQGLKRDLPTVIRACQKDKVAPIASVMWVADRCYGGEEIVQVDDRVRSHEIMTMFGGPPGRPILMHEIANEWGLLPVAS